MSSKTKNVIELQKNYYETALLERNTVLKDRGLEESVIRKDVGIRSLRAKLRQINRRLSAVSHIEKQYDVLARRKREGDTKKSEKERPAKKKTKRDAEKEVQE